jgi:hypothetical protein
MQNPGLVIANLAPPSHTRAVVHPPVRTLHSRGVDGEDRSGPDGRCRFDTPVAASNTYDAWT